jgi:glycerol dehydrogenase
MLSTTIFPGRYIQGYEAIRRLGSEAERFGRTAFLLCSNTVYEKILPSFKDDLAKHVHIFPEKFRGECCDAEIDRVIKLADKTNCDVVIGMGGGKVMDTAKVTANKLRLPLIIVPTVATSDAPCSAVSVIYTPDGTYDRPMPHLHNPAVVLVDTKIISEAPVRFLVAGMGDALSTRFEAESCQAKYAPNMTFSGDIGSMTAYSLAQLCYQTLLKYGLAAKRACEVHAVIPALEHIVEANTLLSGLGFESCGLAGAHGIQIGFTTLKETKPYLHGEIVAFGTQASLFLTDRKKAIIEEVYNFCESVSLPTTLADIGLPAISELALSKVAEVILDKDNPVHNEPIPLTREALIAAIKTADYTGSLRKQELGKKG